GGGQRADAREPVLVDQTVLQRAVDALAAAAGLRGEAQDVLDAEPRESPAHLGEPPPIGTRVRSGGIAGPARAVGVQGHRYAVALDDRPQGGQDRLDALPTLPELGVEQLLGRVVHDGDERVPLLRLRRQPAVAAAIQMQQFAEARPRLAPAAVAAPGAVL